ncbi:LTA synthase family protein [Cobetia crustatorum]|uniref:Sulfatase-like hydrolase/transferase n=1 Tax=Cobetia crustatorum TaxID=553385 RepID=A0A558HQ90_9GAMM|nr:alkaline phosphatase family protein [Cobetia crustatorum]TVU71296.1 sulfatase-like hydrolase/transferase [Cobetia crustatorum]
MEFVIAFVSFMVWPLLIGLAMTLGLEHLLLRQMIQPPTAFLRRPVSAKLAHIGYWCASWSLCTLATQRPWFSVVVVNALWLVVLQVSHTKYVSLREPFLSQDFEYFTDAIKHPRLYIPFFGIGLTIAAISAGALAIGLGLWLEPALSASQYAVTAGASAWLMPLISVLIASSTLSYAMGSKLAPKVILAPEFDLHELGMVAYLLAYARLARRPLTPTHDPLQAAQREVENTLTAVLQATREDGVEVTDKSAFLPHVVSVQSESFFDARRIYPQVRDDLLPHLDRCHFAALAQGLPCGRLAVPAWGANTVRTETAFLTGLTPEQLGVHQFNPYHQLAKRAVPNLAASYKALGYRTLCIHPYPGSFYLRNQVLKQLGFDEFLDIAHFSSADKCGQYISDAAVAAKVEDCLLNAGDAPLFIQVITMENHGPLHLETLDDVRLADWYEGELPENCRELGIYLRHLVNADAMIDQLSTALSRLPRGGLLCFYGDHVPIMPEVYQTLGEPNGVTDTFIWSTHLPQSADVAQQTMDAVREADPELMEWALDCDGAFKTDEQCRKGDPRVINIETLGSALLQATNQHVRHSAATQKFRSLS